MNTKRFSFVMIALLVLVGLVGIGAVYEGNAILTKASNKLVDLKLQNRLIDEQQTAIKTADADIQKYTDLYNIAKSVVPQDKDQAQAVLEIVNIAKNAGMTISQVSFPTSTLGVTSSGGGGGANSISQAKPVPGLSGVYSIDIVVQPTGGDYSSFLKFLENLENNRRTAQVSTVSIHPQSDHGKITGYTFQLTVSIFIKPGAN